MEEWAGGPDEQRWAWRRVGDLDVDQDLYRRLSAADHDLSEAYSARLEYALINRSAPSPLWRSEREFLGLYLGLSLPRWTTQMGFREADRRSSGSYGIVNLRPGRGINVQLPVIADGVFPVPQARDAEGYCCPVLSDCMKYYGPMWWGTHQRSAPPVPLGVPWCRVESEVGGSCAEASLFMSTLMLAGRRVAVSGCFEFDIRGKLKDPLVPFAVGGMDLGEFERAIRNTPGAEPVVVAFDENDDHLALGNSIVEWLSEGLPVIAIIDAAELPEVYPEAMREEVRAHAVVIIGYRCPRRRGDPYWFMFQCSSYLPFRCASSERLMQAMRQAWRPPTIIVVRPSPGSANGTC